MKITVCIKRVPDTESHIRIAADGVTVDAAGIRFIISPYDEYALEAALRMKDAGTAEEVCVVSVGESIAAEQLRAALAMGADRAVLRRGTPGMDGLATARALAACDAVTRADLVLMGMKAVDGDQQQVGPMLAELVDRACITVAAELEVKDDSVIVHREIEGGIEVVEAKLPAVVTVTKGEHEPRYPSLKGIMAAKRKPLEEGEAQLGETRIRVLRLADPPERPPGRIVGQGPDAVPELVRLLHEEAGVL